jgi:membrane protein DedA with SNARE-associated domain
MLEFLPFHYGYLALFVGMMLGGDTVSLPALYLGIIGRIDIIVVALLSIISGITSDPVWYFLGRIFSNEKIKQWRIVNRYEHSIEKFSTVFREHSLKALFYSKFTYGTRNPVKILCGIYRIPFWKYMLVSAAGVTSWTLFIITIGSFLHRSFGAFERIVYGTQIAFVSAVVLVLAVSYFIRKKIFK